MFTINIFGTGIKRMEDRSFELTGKVVTQKYKNLFLLRISNNNIKNINQFINGLLRSKRTTINNVLIINTTENETEVTYYTNKNDASSSIEELEITYTETIQETDLTKIQSQIKTEMSELSTIKLTL